MTFRANPLRAHPRTAVLVCAAVVYAAALTVPFEFDDRGVVPDASPGSLAGLVSFSLHGLRPLLRLTYAGCAALGTGPFAYHLFNLVVHLGAVALVMALAEAATSVRSTWPFRPTSAAPLAAGLLFALHPIQTEAVTYVSGRSSSLMALFYLAAVLAHVQGVRGGRPLLWALVAPALWVCALLVKESAATLPLALLAWDLCVERSRTRDLLRRQGLYAVLLLAVGAAVVLSERYYALLWNVAGQRPLGEAIRYQLHGVAYLASHLVEVRSLSIDPGLGFAEPPALAAPIEAGLLLALVVAALLLRRRSPAGALGVLWWVLHLMLPYAVLSRVDVINERHAYLANAGLAIAAGALFVAIEGWMGSRSLAYGSGLGLVALLAAATVARNLEYATPRSLWEQTVRVSPDNPRAHYNLATVEESAGRNQEALDGYLRALVLEPRYEAAQAGARRVDRRLGR